MKQTLGILLLILASSCLPDLKQDVKISDYYYILKQESPNGKYKIYNYCRSGMMAFSSDICGTQIQKKESEFKERAGIELNGKISKWIGKDTLEIYRFKSNADLERPKDTLSTITYEKAYDLTLKVINYDRITGGFLNEYYFNEINIDSKKVKLNGLKRKLDPIIGVPIELELGNIEIESKNDTISKIVFNEVKTSMNGQYRNPDGSVTENLPQIMTKSTYFYPTKKLLTSDFQNKVGVYYDIKTTGNSVYN
ncbi:hypothetical protein NYZ99_04860 [Maribacter litopenaei]|uniref:Uncharacterized protein n=1 Tax=Maribacter litopenaei TaxID=2976127 RepID=A0ABY5YD00_9FLAO|nr:hypothetical protein [Maribacter litopenaei]UWX55756.1 hypothetical protein NYZ99_04860 [Maribacter litopenaei]